MSGGLDSTVAALKLMDEGHCVEGAVLVMHEHTDVAAAESAAASIGINLHKIDASEKFEAVKENFANEYSLARTPNPCIICNPLVKFAVLAEFARANGFDRIATGHYASVRTLYDADSLRYALVRSADSKKDQTYMLHRLPQDILSMLVLPLAECVKSDVRKMAENKGLAVASKKESQEICFIPDGDYAGYVESVKGTFPEGDFVDDEGNVLGRHKGIIRYTVGQRKGLGISAGQRIFVSSIDPVNNRVVLSLSGSLTDTVSVSNIVFSGMCEPSSSVERRVSAKLRYLAPPVMATALFDGMGGCTLHLDEPVKAVAPGQSAVLYDGDTVIAGGLIN